MEKFQYLKNEKINLPTYMKTQLENKYDTFRPIFVRSLIISTTLCILSPITLLITSTMADQLSTYGVVGLFFIISIAVYMIIYVGTIQDGFNTLLNKKNKS